MTGRSPLNSPELLRLNRMTGTVPHPGFDLPRNLLESLAPSVVIMS